MFLSPYGGNSRNPKINSAPQTKAISKGNAWFYFRPSYMLKTLAKIRKPSDVSRVTKGAFTVVKGKILHHLTKPKNFGKCD